MVSTTAVSEMVSGVLRAPRRSVGTLSDFVPRPGSPVPSVEPSLVLDAVRRDPALTTGQRIALAELYESFRASSPGHVDHDIDHGAAVRAHVC